MNTVYAGTLEYADPLYEILFSQVTPEVKDPIFHVSRTLSSGVYKYTEQKTRVGIIGKFFRPDDPNQDKILRIKGEYDNLQKIRSYGFDTSPNYVVRPLGREEKIGLAVLEEFIRGRDLDYYLKKAIYEGDTLSLKKRLSRLASFLYAWHKRTEQEQDVQLHPVSAYFQKVTNKLFRQGVISESEWGAYLKLMDQWLDRDRFHEAKSVIVHGDATPTNFIFTDKGDVVAIDLERMKDADTVFDIGMVCGELKHSFMWRTGNPYLAEPFIRHFFESYSRLFDSPQSTFREITLRNPFYMAMTELRIARNDYLDLNYRKRLAHEALQCLKWGLKLE